MTPAFQKAPFPYFGGKSSVAPLIWRRLGNVPNYVEPFAGSLAVLLNRPHPAKTETVNDLDGLLSNFWRAVKMDPARVAAWADFPVSEIDLHARGDWLCREAARIKEGLQSCPDWFDAKAAGWWVWGKCAWIGGGWCEQAGLAPAFAVDGDAGMGVNRQLPHLGDAGRGVNRQLPHLGDAGRGEYLRQYMAALSARLRDVRIACGSWERVCTPSVTTRHGTTGVFLDPPYGEGSGYGYETSVAGEVAEWAFAHGDDPAFRIVLCGYAGTATPPDGWHAHRWKARGGYGSQGDGEGRTNAGRETLWFSPHCLTPQPSLFAEVPA